MDNRTPAERAYDAIRDGSAYVKAEPADTPLAPVEQAAIECILRAAEPVERRAAGIQTERHVCQDEQDPQYGQHIGTSYLSGGVELYVPAAANEQPGIYAFGRDPLPLAEVEQALPHIVALLELSR